MKPILKNITGVPLAVACRRARVPEKRVRKLIRERIIFGPVDSSGEPVLSLAVVSELSALCRKHFDWRGDFLHNPPTIADVRGRTVDGVTTSHERVIL